MLSIRTISLIGIVTTIVSVASVATAHAQSCAERFIKAASEGNGEGQYRQIVTQEIKGTPSQTIHEFIMKSHRHWLTKPIEPKGTGWTLLYDGAIYSSLDEGSSWKQVNKFDEQAAEAARAQQKRDVEGVTQLECTAEMVDGQTLDRVHGQYEVTTGFQSTQIHTYWIDPGSGLIVRSRYETLSPAFNSTVSQKMIPFGDAVLPVPQ